MTDIRFLQNAIPFFGARYRALAGSAIALVVVTGITECISFLCEANVNIDQPDFTIPVTAA